jgi:hypothetical protein
MPPEPRFAIVIPQATRMTSSEMEMTAWVRKPTRSPEISVRPPSEDDA